MSVIIQGHVEKQLTKFLEAATPNLIKVLLLPSIDKVIDRDSTRGSNLAMGECMVREHYKYFKNNDFASFTRIDSSKQSVDETVAQVWQLWSGLHRTE
jgi:hypothetical protein